MYTAIATTSGGGREGHAETSDGKVSLDLSYPSELGGSGNGTNPEQLVALGYSACFSNALALVARRRHLDATQASTTCKAHLHSTEDGYALTFEIVVDLPAIPREQAEEVVAEAHALCPYSRAFAHGAQSTARLND
jgi:Ohr subfamily peroxiredoxin